MDAWDKNMPMTVVIVAAQIAFAAQQEAMPVNLKCDGLCLPSREFQGQFPCLRDWSPNCRPARRPPLTDRQSEQHQKLASHQPLAQSDLLPLRIASLALETLSSYLILKPIMREERDLHQAKGIASGLLKQELEKP